MRASWRQRLANFLIGREVREAQATLIEKERAIEQEINQRVAKTLAQMDPFAPLLKEFHGVFSEEYERPEDQLDDRHRINMYMWAYQQRNDPFFKYLTEWIMNTHANETLKKAHVTPERILYGRAQISTMILLKREIGRLATLYEDELEKHKINNFDNSVSVE